MPHTVLSSTSWNKKKLFVHFEQNENNKRFYVFFFFVWFPGAWILCADVSGHPMKMEQTGCSEMPTHKIQTPENHPKEGIQHWEHGESLKSRKSFYVLGGLLATKWHQCPLDIWLLGNDLVRVVKFYVTINTSVKHVFSGVAYLKIGG
jgi:hypothetical protein